MAALAAAAPTTSVGSWIPEDDLLLKNAVEAGASLEALAKGAVRFSRKFTVRELRDRWHSLLYDDDVSGEASARMVEFELSATNLSFSGFNRSGGSREFAEVSGKRKVDSVRRIFYAMRKRARARDSESLDIEFLDGLDSNDCLDFGQPESGDCVFGGPDQNHFGFVEGTAPPCEIPATIPSLHVERSASSPRVPLWKTIEDIAAPEMPINNASVSNEGCGEEETLIHPDGMELDGEKISLSGMDAVHPGSSLQGKHDADVLNSFSISESDFADLSDSLLNFVNEEQQPFLDADKEDTIHRTCHDSLNSLSGSAATVVQQDTADIKGPLILDSDTCPAELGGISEGPVPGDQFSHLHADVNLPSSTSASNTLSVEQSCGEECVLNTEDSQIPCNDDIVFAKKVTSSVWKTTSRGTGHLTSFCKQKDNKQEQILVKREDNPVQSLNVSRKVGLGMLAIPNQNNQLGSFGVKSETSFKSPNVVSHQIGNPCGNSFEQRSFQPSPISATVGGPKAEPLHACNTMSVPLYTKGSSASSPTRAISVPEADPSTSNEEESLSVDDVPSFSDLEAMILEMDLCPDYSNSYVNNEVLKYQNEETRRAIVRLEQCARSSMQRAIMSRGALAIFYGQHLKHYIKETEVILGRATEDVDVDIDLGREGPANKISRRQALIRLERDGSFFLKNLGKSPIYLNGKELVAGQSMNLGSSSLIEIRGMAFVFETDNKAVRQYLGNVAKRPRKNVKFEWSEVVP